MVSAASSGKLTIMRNEAPEGYVLWTICLNSGLAIAFYYRESKAGKKK
jgi:hypothetical protein